MESFVAVVYLREIVLISGGMVCGIPASFCMSVSRISLVKKSKCSPCR